MPLQETMAYSRVFRGAGTFMLVRHGADGKDSKDPADIFTSGNVVMGTVDTSYSTSSETLKDENSDIPAATYPTGVTAGIAISLNSWPRDLDKFLKGAKRVEGSEADVPFINELYTIPEDGSLDLGTGVKISDKWPVVVRDAMTNEDYTKGSATPAATGEFVPKSGANTIAFYADDAGKAVYVSCHITVPKTVEYVIPSTVSSAVYTLYLYGDDYAVDETNRQKLATVYDSVKPSGDLKRQPRQRMPGSTTVNFDVQAPRPGNAMIRDIYSNPLEEAETSIGNMPR